MIRTTQFLVTGMLVSGVCNTILNKLQDNQCVANCDDPDTSKYFEQPVWQTLNMFVGEAMCFMAGYAILLWEHRKAKRSYELLGTQGALTQDSTAIVTSNDVIPQDEYFGSGEDLTGWRVLIMWLPTMCDILATTFMNVGLIYTTASVYQMLRGSVVLFTGTFSVLLRKHLYPYHWFSLFLVMLGVSIVGMSSILFPAAKYSVTTALGGTLSLSDRSTTVRINSSTDPASLPYSTESIIGVFFVLFAQIFTAAQFVIEEKIMERYRIKPLRAVGLEGMFGLVTVVGGMTLLYFLVGISHPGGYFDIPAGFHQIISNRQIWISGILICFSIAFFNFFGLSVTRTISATSRSTIDTSRIVFIWMISLTIGWETFSWLQVVGFIILIWGTFTFNNVMSPPSCFAVPPPQTNENQPLLPEDHEHT